MFTHKDTDGTAEFAAVQAVREIREVYAAFVRWAASNAALSSGNDFEASATESGDLVFRTGIGPVYSQLQLVRGSPPVGRVVFYEEGVERLGIEPRAVFAIRLTPDFDITSGDDGTRIWGRRERDGWVRSEANRLGYNILMAQMAPR